MTHSQRELLRWAATMGWRLVRLTGSGHLQLRHRNGSVAHIASTPGDNRSGHNSRAQLRRLAAQKRRPPQPPRG